MQCGYEWAHGSVCVPFVRTNDRIAVMVTHSHVLKNAGHTVGMTDIIGRQSLARQSIFLMAQKDNQESGLAGVSSKPHVCLTETQTSFKPVS